LHGNSSIPVTLLVFDVRAVAGLATRMQPYSERRALLETLEVEGTRRSRTGRLSSTSCALGGLRVWSPSACGTSIAQENVPG
jgi:ATP-dependent DNA ligase